MDTHHPHGYLDPLCSTKFDSRLKNVIACSDEMVYDFVEWIKKQAFFKNITVIIVGDHIAMPNDLSKSLTPAKDREVVNVFINPLKKTDKPNRAFCILDFMPTIIESIGGKIEGGRLVLGTSLFSGKKTLMEE